MPVTHPKMWIPFVVLAATLGARAAHADSRNEIRAVTFDDDGAMTRVSVRGATTPTFTVYKLERPSRVVIDVPQARLGEALRGHEGAATFTPSTWAVSTIAAQQIDDGGQVVRVIVTLARPGRYDVKTDGNSVVVMVTARDPAPALAPKLGGVDPKQAEALAKAQAESASAKQAAATADQARLRAEQASLAAQAEADRLRKAAESAQRAADEAKRSGTRNSAELDKANRVAQDAARAQAVAEQAKRDAIAEAARANLEADRAKQDAARTLAAAAQAKAEADRAKQDAARTKSEADRAKQDAARTKSEADRAKQDAARTLTAAEQAKADAARAKSEADRTMSEAEQARQDAARAKADAIAMAAKARAEAEQAKRDAEKARAEIAKSTDAAARTKAEAEAAKADAARMKAETARMKAETEATRLELVAARREAAQNRSEKDALTADAARARDEARIAKADAEAMKAEAAKTLADAKAQLATIEKRTQSAQAMEDKARASHAAAVAREEAARDVVARAARELDAAEQAAIKAAQARDRSSSQVASEKAKLIAEAKAAEERLAKATRAAEDAEARRTAAETAADGARKQLDTSRSTLASMEQQRTAAEQAAREAARLRGEAEAAASDASRRRSEAEKAAAVAARQRTEAEAAARDADKQRAIAEAAARDADKQRMVSEAAAKKAVASKHDAESSLEELITRRKAAERAALELEARSKAEAKAQTELAAAQARQAGEAELAKVRREATRLADERKRAEEELAERRKAVATQQAQADRLKTEAAQARDAAEREEQRRSQLAAARVAEEQALAKLQAQKVAVAATAKPAPVPVQVPVQAPVVKAAFVKDITFKGDDAGGHVDIALAGEGKITVGEVSATHAELIIDGAELAAKLERKLDVRKFGSPVRAVSSFRDRRTPNRVRLVAELDAPATPSLDRDASGVRWTFTGKAPARAPRTQNVPPPVVGGFGAASTPITQQSVSQVPQAPRNRRVYRGEIVDLDYKDAPIHDLLRQLAMTGKVNIVVPEGIDAKVSVVLKKVPWDQALEVILASHGLWYRRDGNLFRVAPRKELDEEDEAEAARREALVKAETPRSELVPLNYASAAELKPKLEAMLSPKGRIEVDDRTNQLIVNDVAGNREQITRLALQLDTQTPQISIEARIVEARSTFLRQIGIQWGGRALMGAAGGNATGLLFPSSIGLQGGAEDQQTNRSGVATPSDFAVNLPAAVGSGEGGAMGLSLGSVAGNLNINLRISALEDTGSVRIISAPKITVLNNKEAAISQGVGIPISVVSAAGTQTQFVQADLSLKVTPSVSQHDCAIAMNLQVTKNEPDFVNVGARGDPTILRKEAKTSMLVNDGETSVLGGIYTRNTGLAYKKVPFFGDLPVLGWFFKNRRENDDRTEILVFITPKITNRARLRCQ